MRPPIPPFAFWGKAEIDRTTGEIVAWHPLSDHCLDVAVVFRALVRLPAFQGRLERAAQRSLSDAQLDRLAVIALLHDLGKLNLGFQGKILPGRREKAGHVRELAPLFDPPLLEPTLMALEVESLAAWFEPPAAFDRFLVAAVSHHGKPIVFDEANRDATYHLAKTRWWRADGERDPWQGMRDLMALARHAFPAAFTDGAPSLPDRVGLQHCFAGLVMLADWIGSHTGFFPYRESWEEDRLALALVNAERALRAIGLDSRAWQRDLAARAPGFAAVFDFPPRPLQARLASGSFSESGRRLLIVESETGSGKTEAALAWFLRLFAAGRVDGLYFALPTRVAARELYGRVVKAINSAFPAAPPSPILLAVPGYARVDGEPFEVLPKTDRLWQDDDRERWRERNWAAEHPKRFLAAPVAVGTLDQALLSILQVKHAHLRSVCLDRQLLVVDEVHASDPYMRHLLKGLLDHHLGLGGYALLLSATLGETARAEFLAPPKGRAAPRPLAEAEALAYPSITTAEGVIEPVPAVADGEKRVRAVFTDAMDDFDTVCDWLTEALAQGARVLVVLNSVARVVALQRRVEADPRIPDEASFRCEGVICPHHGRFARADRERLDAAVSNRFGKTSAPGPALLIGTQTLEQSLDIDADWLLTDHCPVDVLLQRIGRLHRHRDRLRPTAYAAAECRVLSLPDATLESLLKKDGSARSHGGLGSVYPDLRALRLTRELFETRPEIVIPRDNRRLVEGALHAEALERYSQGVWAKHRQKVEGDALAQTLAAFRAALNPQPFGEFTFAELGEQIRTRLGLDDRRARLPAPVTSPFGQTLAELPIPGHLAPKALDEEAAGIDCAGAEIRFRLGERRYRYTRMGLELADE